MQAPATESLRRREFIAFLGGAGVAWPLPTRAQHSGKVYRLAILVQAEPIDRATGTRHRFWTAYFEELRRLGYTEGRNLSVEWHPSAGDAKHVTELARHVAGRKPDAIFTPDQRMTGALKAAKTTIPIVAILSDPVSFGFATSLARPGGNITGFSVDAGPEIGRKRLAWLKEAVPTASRLAWLTPRRHWESRFRDAVREAAEASGMTMVGAVLEEPVKETEYRRVFKAMARDRVDSLSVSPVLEHMVHRRLIAELAAELRLPAICAFRENAEAGGLMAYAVDLVHMFRGAAGYIDRILKGADPGALPIQQPSKFELVINLKTAKALGITLPESALSRADEVIE